MAILGIIMLPMYNILQVAVKSWKFEDTRAEVVQNARIAMERMTHEIRETREVYDAAGELIYFWWKDGLGDSPGIADDNEKITYSLVGENLTRKDATMAEGEPVAEYVQGFALEYRKSDGTVLSIPVDQEELANIHLITINLTIENKGHSTTVRASLHPRNM